MKEKTTENQNDKEEKMANGYMGKILNVNLTTGSIETEALNESICQDYIGGYGLGARLLYDRIPNDADPLGPDNILGLLTGPLTGTCPPRFSASRISRRSVRGF